jgi:hypothetical protein
MKPSNEPQPLAIWTADTAVITCDSTEFTADGACLVNGGGTQIPERTRDEVGYTAAGIRRW